MNTQLSFYLACILTLGAWLVPLEADAAEPPRRLRALYASLDPSSVAQHLALYQLYPATPEGQAALSSAWRLLNTQPVSNQGSMKALPLPTRGIQAIVAVVNKHPYDAPISLTDPELAMVDRLAAQLPNRQLKGFRATTEAAVLALEAPDIDLARGLFLSQLGESPDALRTILNYEAMLDLMALQIQCRLKSNATPEAKIRILNRFVFEEMNFRFPPHSTYAKDIDIYTFLPSVLDTRRGVCLGVSVMYLCLAQRLNLPLEIVTPPGHIYVRYRGQGREINIETTLRGVHVDSEEYLGVDTCKLQQRDLKETIGLAHINQASVYLQTGEFEKAVVAYEKAEHYLPDDKLLKELLGYSLVLSGQEVRGTKMLETVRDYHPDESVSHNIMVADFLDGRMGNAGLEAIFMRVDENSESLQTKRQALVNSIVTHPDFRSGWLQLATTLLQMHRSGEALECLERYHALDQTNVSAEYFLAAVNGERLDYSKAWTHLQNAEKLLEVRNHQPKALETFRRQLSLKCPE